MRVLIVSDTHRKMDNLIKVIRKEKPMDMIIHCGDAEGDENQIEKAAGCPLKIVLGNNDFFSDLPREIEIQIGQYNVWITHGHNYYVSMGNELIKEEAKGRGMDIVIYGHTHRPIVDIDKDIIAVNPGSLTYPRQEGRKPSYVIMNIEQDNKVHFEIFYL